jgi:hypothetical protein
MINWDHPKFLIESKNNKKLNKTRAWFVYEWGNWQKANMAKLRESVAELQREANK